MEVIKQQPHLHKDWIDPHAYGIVKALQKAGYTTYLVGGCVRDLLLNIHPKDYDIATKAHPPQVKRLIYMSFIIGKRFRLVLVKRDQQQFEVATFRRDLTEEEVAERAAQAEASMNGSEEEMAAAENAPALPSGDNIFGEPEEDAKRRDFTINALFYDPIADQLIDYVGGMDDIQKRCLRMIGDPNKRLVEDPIRILRGLRFAHKSGFTIEHDLRAAMQTHAPTLAKAVLPRRREEILKILRLDNPDLALVEAYDLGILQYVLPTLHELFADSAKKEIFFAHFRVCQRMAPEGADTVHLFGWLLFSYFRTLIEEPTDDQVEQLVNDEKVRRMMREELGMFNYEQSSIGKALEIIPFLKRWHDFKKRGHRRQLAFLKNEGFALALRMAEVDYLFGPEVIQFWRNAYAESKDQLAAMGDDRGRVRPNRPNRRRRQDRRDRREKPTDKPSEA